MKNFQKIALFPGSFDPFTKGHEDIVLRGSTLFDHLVVGIGNNGEKDRCFPVDLIKGKIETTFSSKANVNVAAYEGLTAQFAKKINARFLLRGLRNVKDFQYENSIAQINRYILDGLETIFILTSPQFAHINSSIVREIYKYGQDIREFLPFNLTSDEF